MTIKNLLELEIKDLEDKLERAKALLPLVKGNALKVCPECDTQNYHYDVKTHMWCCAFC